MSKTAEDFDLDNPKLPKAIEERALTSGNYPYEKRLDKDLYAETLETLQVELVKLQAHALEKGTRLVLLFEGRDAAGKGGAIKTYLEYLNPRYNIGVALPKPSDREQSQWYFQRYVDWMPAAGETALFDRSWYNRAGVEKVMGFCTTGETESFLLEAPRFESMLVNDDIKLFKFWLSIGREMQLKRFHERRHNPLKTWKLSPIDLKALEQWDAYTEARDAMLPATDTAHAPWTMVRANDKRRARLGVIQTVLSTVDYKGKDKDAIGAIDDQIVLGVDAFLKAGS
jgi:polyphosphate kinase 2